MKGILSLFLISLCTVGVFAQKTKTVSRTKKSALRSISTPKKELEDAVSKSMKAEKFRVKVQGNVLNNEIFSTFEYSSPGRYRSTEAISGKAGKEIIEIAEQRYQKKNGQWIKTRFDYAPLRNQLIVVFPIKLSSGPDDPIAVKNAKAESLGEENLDGKECRKFGYTVSYRDADFIDSGVVWVNKASGLLTRLETKTNGIFGQTTGVFTYFYNEEINIEPPQDFIEKDWID